MKKPIPLEYKDMPRGQNIEFRLNKERFSNLRESEVAITMFNDWAEAWTHITPDQLDEISAWCRDAAQWLRTQ